MLSFAADTFCMVVYDCKVDDGTGDVIQLLDQDGCALDKYLLGNLEYPTDLMAGKEAHAFKYADRPNLYFNCQIKINVKEPGVDCPKPTCTEPARKKRSTRNDVSLDCSLQFLPVTVDYSLSGAFDNCRLQFVRCTS